MAAAVHRDTVNGGKQQRLTRSDIMLLARAVRRQGVLGRMTFPRDRHQPADGFKRLPACLG